MRKKCHDPHCPANQSQSRCCRQQRPRSKRHACPVRSESSKRRRISCERAEKPRKRSSRSKNKKCQVSKRIIESSTMVSTMRDDACNPWYPTRKSRQRGQPRGKRSPRREQRSLCMCVTGSSSENLRCHCKCPEICPRMPKYDCCCMRNNNHWQERKESRSRSKKKSSRKCTCKPGSKKGLSLVRRKIKTLQESFSRCEQCNEPRVCDSCSAHRYYSNNSFRNRGHKSEKRRVKFH